MYYDQELELLTKDNLTANKLAVLEKYGIASAATDLSIISGVIIDDNNNIPDDQSLTGRVANYYTKTTSGSNVYYVSKGDKVSYHIGDNNGDGIRPIIKSSFIFDRLSSLAKKNELDISEVEYGEFPQYAESKMIIKLLEEQLEKKELNIVKDLKFTLYIDGKKETYPVYEFEEEKYIRCFSSKTTNYYLSNGFKYNKEEPIWIRVKPVVWLLDYNTKTLISKNTLAASLTFSLSTDTKADYEKRMKPYLRIMNEEMFVNSKLELTKEEIENFERRKNPYGFDFEQTTQEELIELYLEGDIPFFLHGTYGIGKSARIKALDPHCIKLYLGNITPEVLNGKSIARESTGTVIDVKPAWLEKLEKLCIDDPDNYHVLFFDEITNALPSIQGMAFNIILDREVNGRWKLPDNCRIAAAGNEMDDSIAANEIAAPLYSRFAHIYLELDYNEWLEWAADNNIHPAVYSYIAFKKGTPLQCKKNGKNSKNDDNIVKPDPRKWEMASRMLYKTKRPDGIKALVGDAIATEFCAFCNQRIITLKDVLTGNYSEDFISKMDISAKYATVIGLSQVDEDNFESIRTFVIEKLSPELGAVLDAMWAKGNDYRKIIVMELGGYQYEK